MLLTLSLCFIMDATTIAGGVSNRQCSDFRNLARSQVATIRLSAIGNEAACSAVPEVIRFGNCTPTGYLFADPLRLRDKNNISFVLSVARPHLVSRVQTRLGHRVTE